MVKQKALYLTKGFNLNGVTFTSTDATSTKALFTAGADDSRITAIAITNTSSSDSDLLLYLNNGTVDYLLGHIDVTANAGFNGMVNQVNGLNTTNLPFLEINNAGVPSLPIKSGWSLRGAMKSTVSGTVTVTIIAEDF